jgi:hypothetical protein
MVILPKSSSSSSLVSRSGFGWKIDAEIAFFVFVGFPFVVGGGLGK